MTKKPSEQLDALAIIIKNDILNKSISEENWTIRPIDDFQLRLTRKSPPCEGLDIYISVTPEHRHVDTNFIKASEEKLIGTVTNQLAKKSGINILDALMEKKDNTEDNIISKLIDKGFKNLEEKIPNNLIDKGAITPSALSQLKKQILENIEKKKNIKGDQNNGIR